jgi:RNA polymerase sigma factor (sigma-70 family)
MQKNSVAEAFKTYGERMLKFIRSRVRQLEDAEDILQDVFYQFARMNDLARPVEQTAAWLYRAARNRIIDKHRKKEDIPFSVLAVIDDEGDVSEIMDMLSYDETAETTGETELLRALVWESLESALNELPPLQREVFVKTELLNMPVKEISHTSGVPVNTLLSRKHYAVVHLRKRLKDLYMDLAGEQWMS